LQMAIGNNTIGLSHPKVIGASIWLLRPILILVVSFKSWEGRVLVKKAD